MTIQNQSIPFEHRGDSLTGYLAWDDSKEGPLPLVLISHAWAGQTDFERKKAHDLAELGYAALAIDLFGKNGNSTEENRALMQPFIEDRAFLQERMKAWLDLGLEQGVTGGPAAAIGFCFGGLCVLDLARTGVDIAGVVSFHGLFKPPETGKAETIPAKILLLHGWDDPMAPPESVEAIAKELTEAGADWRLHAYGGTMHAFTNPKANDPDFGTVYNARADALSWREMKDFLAEIF